MLNKLVVGLFLSPGFLGSYLAAGALYFIILPLLLSSLSCSDALFMTLGLLTGSDPFSFKDTLKSSEIAWVSAWLIHSASWLIIPILVGLIFSERMGRMRSERRRELLKTLETFGQQAGQFSMEEAREFARAALEAIEQEG